MCTVCGLHPTASSINKFGGWLYYSTVLQWKITHFLMRYHLKECFWNKICDFLLTAIERSWGGGYKGEGSFYNGKEEGDRKSRRKAFKLAVSLKRKPHAQQLSVFQLCNDSWVPEAFQSAIYERVHSLVLLNLDNLHTWKVEMQIKMLIGNLVEKKFVFLITQL